MWEITEKDSKKMEEAGSNCFVRHAFKEQRDLGLSWNTNIETARSVLRQLDGHQLEHTPLHIREAIQLQADMEHRAIVLQETYVLHTIKMSFGYEQYLDMNLSYKFYKL